MKKTAKTAEAKPLPADWKQAISAQQLPTRDSKIKKWEDLFYRKADLRGIWDGGKEMPGLSNYIQRRISDQADKLNDAIRALIELTVPEARKANKAIPPELLKLRQTIGEMTLGAWNAACSRPA